jgi:hypothetical protein
LGKTTSSITFSEGPDDELSVQESNILADTLAMLFYRLEEKKKEHVHCMTDFHV